MDIGDDPIRENERASDSSALPLIGAEATQESIAVIFNAFELRELLADHAQGGFGCDKSMNQELLEPIEQRVGHQIVLIALLGFERAKLGGRLLHVDLLEALERTDSFEALFFEPNEVFAEIGFVDRGDRREPA